MIALCLLVALLVCALLPYQCLALEKQFNFTHKRYDPDLAERLLSLSTDSPASRELRAQPSLGSKLAPAFGLLEHLANVFEVRQKKEGVLSCNLPRNLWVQRSLDNADWTKYHLGSVKVRQLGEFSDLCQSHLSFNGAVLTGEVPQSLADDARTILASARRAGYDALVRSGVLPAEDATDHDWPRGPHNVAGWDLQLVGQTCSVDSLFAYRVRGEWFLRVEATNNPVDAVMPDWKRQTLFEHVRRGFELSLQLPHRDYDTGNLVNSTTMLERWSGRALMSATGPMTPEENPAITEATRRNALEVAQAEDAVTTSNIAILALPMAMSLIPVAFVAELGSLAFVAYVLFTDVASTLPFLIKGGELVHLGQSLQRETAAYTMGNETLGQMEVWTAECRGAKSFGVKGFIFIALALLAIALGIFLEVFATLVMRRRRRETGKAQTEGLFGEALLERLAYAPVGSGDAHEHARDVVNQLRERFPGEWRRRVGREEREGGTVMRVDTPGAGPFSSTRWGDVNIYEQWEEAERQGLDV